MKIALILCAGRGTRLGLKDIPKCMVDIKSKPLLERIASDLEKRGFRVIVNLSQFPEVVMKYFGQRFLYLYEPIPMGEVTTVDLIKGWFPGEDILVVNGDTLIGEPNIKNDKHCGMTYYYANGIIVKKTGYDFIDCGTLEGLEKAREYVRN